MLYEIHHRTTYDYDEDVSLSHHVARLTPRDLPHQRRHRHQIETSPRAATRSSHTDHFGNTATFLTIEGSHRSLELVASSVVEVLPVSAARTEESPPWETVRDLFTNDYPKAPVEAIEFIFGSPLVPRRGEFGDYAKKFFSAGRPVREAAIDLCACIHRDFKFDPRATTVTTPVGEFFNSRRGVCQDFAHFMIACLRSLGLPARYVSGYLETIPPPGRPKLVGTDASHAWLSLWCGNAGWVDLDPTNNLLPAGRHITAGFGRDFSDVSPVRGMITGSGAHSLNVAVDVTPLPDN